MKKPIFISFIFAAVLSCKKEKLADPMPPLPAHMNNDSYSSLADFYGKNGVNKSTFTFNTATGGTFVTPQATTISIPPNAFTQAGNVKLEFRDIYKKSDMLLSKMPTNTVWGPALVSAGEFFIKASINNMSVQITPSVGIEILQPLSGAAPDTGMKAFIALPDTGINNNWNWAFNPPGFAGLGFSANNYIHSLYQFSSPADSGSWCNSDNPYFFSAYPQTTLTIHPNDMMAAADVYLVFKTVKSMVHVYRLGVDFVYDYAPMGLQCSVVCIGINVNGKLMASFTPITIGSNQTVNFSMSEMTTDDFKTALKALD